MSYDVTISCPDCLHSGHDTNYTSNMRALFDYAVQPSGSDHWTADIDGRTSAQCQWVLHHAIIRLRCLGDEAVAAFDHHQPGPGREWGDGHSARQWFCDWAQWALQHPTHKIRILR